MGPAQGKEYQINRGMAMQTLRNLVIGLALTGLIAACATTGPGGKKSLILISDAQEVSIGQQVDEEVRANNTIYPDEVWQDYLAEVGEKIVAVCDRPNLDYQFHVIESDQINAFATPGGFVYFYTGILRMMDNEAELAAVMAHEISHVVGRHSVKTLQAAYGGIIALELALGDKSEGAAGQLAGSVLGIALTGYGRSNELEADEFGVYYMEKAGYNPHGAISMFTKLAELSGDQGGRGFFENLTASHPETQERIRKINEQIAAMPRSVDNLPYFKDRYQLLKQRLPAPADST
jgi:predicted Zn-dependent protease